LKKIGIIGAGFSGIMTTTHLIQKSKNSVEIIIVDKKELFNKGVAYNSFSNQHILNVSTAKMSAFPNQPNHFLDWIKYQPEFQNINRKILAESYQPRNIYGKYLSEIWEEAKILAGKKKIKLTVIDDYVSHLEELKDKIIIRTEKHNEFNLDFVVIATGNQLPRNPKIKTTSFYSNENYFQNPWSRDSVKRLNPDLPVLILGNGLTMVDTVLSILEQNFKGKIISLSPNGFNILSHKHSYLTYQDLANDLESAKGLKEVFSLIHRHIKIVRSFGLSAEPVIDAVRPFTQRIWQSFSDDEKRIFMSRFRHLWGVARHRLPLSSFDKIQQLKIKNKLQVISGKLLDLNEANQAIEVEYWDKLLDQNKKLQVGRIINCTGPETDFLKLKSGFLKQSIKNGLLSQDFLKLGLNVNVETFQTLNSKNKVNANIYAIGSLLKGELWESTAVSELRLQADQLSNILLNKIKN